MPWISPTYEYEVLMIGNTGVGKTSLLASMYEQLSNSISQHIKISIPDMKTGYLLGEALSQLKFMCDTDGLIPGLGVEGTSEPKTFVFDIAQNDQTKPSFKIKIHDYPGGYFNPGIATSEQTKNLEAILDRAFMIFVVIDMPSLMEQNGKFNDIRNTPFLFREFLCNQILKRNKTFPILLTGLRGEKYIRSGDFNEATKKVYRDYEKLIKLSQNLKTEDTTFCCFPQTVGSIEFDSFLEKKNAQGKIVPTYLFKKISMHSLYRPQDCDLPLKFLLANAVATSVVQRRQYWEGTGVNVLRDFFDRDVASISALSTFSDQLKNANLFTFLR